MRSKRELMRYFAPRFIQDAPVQGDVSTMSRPVRNLLVVVAVLGIGLAGGWFLARQQGVEAPANAQAPVAQTPFGPGGAPRATAVVAEPVRYAAFDNEVEALGTARANESINVTAEIANLVTAIRFDEGEQVAKDDVLIELDSAEARANLAIAEAALKDSRSQFARSRELFATKALSEAQLDQLEATLVANEARVAAARARLEDTVIRAPFAGRVGLRRVSVGGLVNPGETITTLDDLSVIKLDFAVPEVFLATLRPGMDIRAKSPAWPDEVFSGQVASIDSRVDPISRSVTVRAQLDNRDRRLKPGMFMTVSLVKSEGRALMLPEQAIVPENDDRYVYRVVDGKAVKTLVETGRRRPGEVEVLTGLDEGDVVVIEGTIKLRDGAAVALREALASQARP
ncbi:MAG TPA: efflux RND transporter periplasmic adaptor subunit [Steroidobacteraceae bacterium]|nr:efflux RND transporter periplasmic adaptor subunit [Steroidobacteraceae bacterium]